MDNYGTSEFGLTKATKVLWARKPHPFVYPIADFDPAPWGSKKPVSFIHKKLKKANEHFQRHRILAVIEMAND